MKPIQLSVSNHAETDEFIEPVSVLRRRRLMEELVPMDQHAFLASDHPAVNHTTSKEFAIFTKYLHMPRIDAMYALKANGTLYVYHAFSRRWCVVI